jgi:tRNA threonylcarbamoyladenosine biosynthesis protein TsaB
MGVLLAIDTSTAVASVALYDGRVLAEATWIAGADHSRQLLPRVADLLHAAGRTRADLTALGVAVGPGSFNGLRVGIATAKAIAEARGLPIAGVDTLLTAAYPFRATGRPIRPLYDAGRGEVATGLYQAGPQGFTVREEPRITALEGALDASPADSLFCGELRPSWREAIARRFGPASLVRPAEEPRRAGYLAELAWERILVKGPDDVATLQPIYLRRPSIAGAARAGGSGSL